MMGTYMNILSPEGISGCHSNVRWSMIAAETRIRPTVGRGFALNMKLQVSHIPNEAFVTHAVLGRGISDVERGGHG